MLSALRRSSALGFVGRRRAKSPAILAAKGPKKTFSEHKKHARTTK